jgi:hypothetical protein
VLRAATPTRNGEIAVNHWLNAHHLLSMAAGYYYGTMHFLVTPIVLGWLWLRRPGAYPRLRSALVHTSISSLVVFWA